MLKELNNLEKLVNYMKLGFTGCNKKDYNFNNFSLLGELFRAIYYGEILIPTVGRGQDNFNDMIKILKVYRPRKDSKYYELKQDLVINAQIFYDGREMIIEAFKNKPFPFYSGNLKKNLKKNQQRVKMKNHQNVKIKYLILVLLNKLLN